MYISNRDCWSSLLPLGIGSSASISASVIPTLGTDPPLSFCSTPGVSVLPVLSPTLDSMPLTSDSLVNTTSTVAGVENTESSKAGVTSRGEIGRIASSEDDATWETCLLDLLPNDSHLVDLLVLCFFGLGIGWLAAASEVLRERASASSRVRLRDMLSGDKMGDRGWLRDGMPRAFLRRKLLWRLWYLQGRDYLIATILK